MHFGMNYCFENTDLKWTPEIFRKSHFPFTFKCEAVPIASAEFGAVNTTARQNIKVLEQADFPCTEVATGRGGGRQLTSPPTWSTSPPHSGVEISWSFVASACSLGPRFGPGRASGQASSRSRRSPIVFDEQRTVSARETGNGEGNMSVQSRSVNVRRSLLRNRLALRYSRRSSRDTWKCLQCRPALSGNKVVLWYSLTLRNNRRNPFYDHSQIMVYLRSALPCVNDH